MGIAASYLEKAVCSPRYLLLKTRSLAVILTSFSRIFSTAGQISAFLIDKSINW
jgi:hypothetical protein